MATDTHRGFASLLDDLLSEEAERADAAPGPLSLDYLAVADELHSGRISFSDRRAQAEYEAQQPLRPAGGGGGERTLMREEALSTDPGEIARELGLAGGRRPGDLDRLRRDFAFSNHPDRVPAHRRAAAMIRMQVANMLIDEAKRDSLSRRGRAAKATG